MCLEFKLILIGILQYFYSLDINNSDIYGRQCSRKTFMVHQTFVWWALYVLLKFVKSLIRNVRHVRWFSWTLGKYHKLNQIHLDWIILRLICLDLIQCLLTGTCSNCMEFCRKYLISWWVSPNFALIIRFDFNVSYKSIELSHYFR